MSQIIRQQPNGNWCIYSTISEDFLIYNATKEELIEWKIQEYEESLRGDLAEIEENGCTPPRTNRTRTLEDCVEKTDATVTDNGAIEY